MYKNHKRPSKLELGFQARIPYNIRSILDGDLASDWETFGGISMQHTHMCPALNLAITENATIAMAYDQEIRTSANELYKFRTRVCVCVCVWGGICLLKEEGQRANPP